MTDGSLCYLRFGAAGSDATAAVILKVAALDPLGRSSVLAHALVGPAELLTPRRALTLRAWPGWFGGGWSGGFGPAAEQVDADAIRRPLAPAQLITKAVEAYETRLERAARDLGAPLVHLVAEILANATHPVSIVGYPGRPEPLLFGLIAVLDGLLGGLPGHDWSFSTGETAEQQSSPRHIFLDHTSRSDFELSRLRVRYPPAQRPGESGAAGDVAARLVTAYHDAELRGVAREFVRALPPASLSAVAGWIPRVSSAPETASGRLFALQRVLRGRGSADDRVELGRADVVPLLQDDLWNLDANGLRWLWSEWGPGTSRLLPASAQPVRAALGELTIRAILAESLAAPPESTAGAGGAGSGDSELDRNVGVAIQHAVQECGLGPAEVQMAVETWWEQRDRSGTGPANGPGRLRAARTAVAIWAEASRPDRDRPPAGGELPAPPSVAGERREFAQALESLLAAVPVERIAERLPTDTDLATRSITLAVTLHVLDSRIRQVGWAGRGQAEHGPEAAKRRRAVRRHLADQDLGVLWEEPEPMPDPAAERRLVIDLLFRPDLADPRVAADPRFVTELRRLLRQVLPPALVADLLTAAWGVASTPAGQVLLDYAANQWLESLGCSALPSRPIPRPADPPRSPAARPAGASGPGAGAAPFTPAEGNYTGVYQDPANQSSLGYLYPTQPGGPAGGAGDGPGFWDRNAAGVTAAVILFVIAVLLVVLVLFVIPRPLP